MSKAKLFLATDHAGFVHKNKVRDYLFSQTGLDYEVVDLGAFVYDESDDYPDFISRAAHEVSQHPNIHRAIIFGGSGQGEAIVANKYSGVRAAVYYGYDDSIVTLAREHNNTNILSIGARYVSEADTISAVEQWLSVPFTQAARHTRRLQAIEKLERRGLWNKIVRIVR